MNLDVAREREIRPGTWVTAVVEVSGLSEEEIAVRVKKRVGSVYRWKKKGMEFLDFIGLLAVTELLDEKAERLQSKLSTVGGLPPATAKRLVEEIHAMRGRVH